MNALRYLRTCSFALCLSLLGAMAVPSLAQGTQTISGVYSFAVIDPTHPGRKDGVQDSLQLPDGRSAVLDVDPELLVAAGGRRALAGTSIQVTATTTVATKAKSKAPLTLKVTSVRGGSRSVRGLGKKFSRLGSLPYVTILCKFKDVTTVPHPKSYYEALLMTSDVSVDKFYRENSRDQMNISGTQVFDWLTLPGNQADYGSRNNMNSALILKDATALFDSQVNFPSYYGINIVLNSDPFGYDLGGYGQPLTIDGQSKTYGVTWLPIVDHEFMTHEMGHSLGMDHSSGPYAASAPYDSNWDMMSGDLYNGTDTYGAIGMNTNGYHKDVMGWLPDSRIFTAARNTRTTVTIERSAQPVSTTNYLLAQIPIPGSTTQYYSIEARRFVGFDYSAGKFAYRANGKQIVCGVPLEGIVIHKVDTTHDFNAYASVVVDGDGNGDVNDAGAAWTPGETYTDATNNMSVKVESSGSSSYTVTLANGVTANPSSLATTEDASKTGTLSATDAGGKTLTYSVVSGPAHGTVSNFSSTTGAFTYTPTANYNGTDSFTFKANNGSADSNIATVSITVAPVPDAPTVDSITPSTSSNVVGDSRQFTLTVSDADGVSDIDTVWFVANNRLDWSDGATLLYVKSTNQLYLRNGDSFTSPITPGAAGTLSNAGVTIDGTTASVSTAGNSLSLSFTAQIKAGMVGTNKVWGRVSDVSGATDPAALAGEFGNVQKGTWTVSGSSGVQAAPTLSLSPGAKGTSTPEAVGTEFTLNVDLSDGNGVGDLQSAYILLNSPGRLGWARGFTLYYEARSNRLYLRSDDGNSFLGGQVVGQGTGTLENESGSVRLEGCTTTSITNGVRLSLPVTFKAAFTGTRQVWSRVQDVTGAVAAASDANFGFTSEGTFVISNTQEVAPTASVQVAGQAAGKGTTTPVTGGSETSFTLDLRDNNGAGQLETGWLLVNTPGRLDWAQAIALVVDVRTGTLYLRSSDGGSWSTAQLTSSTGGASGTLENDAVSVRLSGCTLTRVSQGYTLVVTATPKAAFAGTRQMWSRVQDSAGNTQAGNDAALGFNTEGQLTINNPVGPASTDGKSGGNS